MKTKGRTVQRGKTHGHTHARKSGMTKHGNHPGGRGGMGSRPSKKI